jgi:hypothetical protein
MRPEPGKEYDGVSAFPITERSLRAEVPTWAREDRIVLSNRHRGREVLQLGLDVAVAAVAEIERTFTVLLSDEATLYRRWPRPLAEHRVHRSAGLRCRACPINAQP